MGFLARVRLHDRHVLMNSARVTLYHLKDVQHDYASSPAESSAFVPLTKPLHFNLLTLITEDCGSRTIPFGEFVGNLLGLTRERRGLRERIR